MNKTKLNGVGWGLALKAARGVICLIVMTSAALDASTLWNNGAVNTTYQNSNQYTDSYSGGSGPFTIFDNFTVSYPAGWLVSGFDITDFFVGTPVADYKSTTWAIWNGNPLTTGQLVATGIATLAGNGTQGTASLPANVNCAVGFTCMEMITVSGLGVHLASGTYYLGTTNGVATPRTDETYRAYGAGNVGGLGDGWEQSNGAITGATWANGTTQDLNNTGDTAFDIIGNQAPEPGTLILMSLALVGLGYKLRRRAV